MSAILSQFQKGLLPRRFGREDWLQKLHPGMVGLNGGNLEWERPCKFFGGTKYPRHGMSNILDRQNCIEENKDRHATQEGLEVVLEGRKEGNNGLCGCYTCTHLQNYTCTHMKTTLALLLLHFQNYTLLHFITIAYYTCRCLCWQTCWSLLELMWFSCAVILNSIQDDNIWSYHIISERTLGC